MSVAFIKTAFITGEVSPSLFGHTDLAPLQAGASTARNGFISYRGGFYSRAGTKFVGFSKQTGRAYPPRMVTFQFSVNQGLALEFGNSYMRVILNGAFVTEAPINITNITGANPGVMTTASDAFVSGDWVALAGIGGMTQLNGQTVVLTRTGASTYQLKDVYGTAINTALFGAYTAGGTAARIYTVTTIYSEVDLAYLKFTESADVMSICCLNQVSGTEYAPQDLSRASNISWTFTPAVPAPTVAPPAVVSITATGTGATTSYSYSITSVSPADGTESIASGQLKLGATANIAAAPGTVTLKWTPLAGVNEYNVYKATPGYASAAIPDGVLFGYVGTAYGNEFIDSNIIPDFAQVPPYHRNPFARGQITGLTVTAGGAAYTVIGYTITTAAGTGQVLQLITSGGALVAAIVIDPGTGYAPGDTITITGDGAGATATLVFGAQTGTYPSVPAYFQERRVYANTLNNPDTYWMSQPGSFTNFDFRIPTIASDAITGTPWGVQVNGIQWMIQTSGGLMIFTGLQTWLLVGTGSFATNVAAISPDNQTANPQPDIGCSPILFPIKVNYDVIFADASSSFYYDQPYQLYALSEPSDVTQYSSHLFEGFTFVSHAWCWRPYKLIWTIRNDGAMLSFTWLKEQKVAAWARHDTQGYFVSNCAVTELPVDALYLAVHRFPGNNQDAYMIERMDNRLWPAAENCWCVDCGLALTQPKPAGTLNIASATGLGACSGVTGLVGGSGFSAATTAVVVDDNGSGPGTGAVVGLTIVAGVITAVAFSPAGTGYVNPHLVITDPSNSGNGASATITLNNSVAISISGGTFASGDVGSVIRCGGGIMVITARADATHITVNMLSPILAVIPNSNAALPAFTVGQWSMTAPVTTISGLNHLIGSTVTGLADGNVITPQVVSSTGTITLGTAASAVIVGLGFQAQLQSLYLETGSSPTVQGQRKKIAEVTARILASRGLKMGSNQLDASTQSPQILDATWQNLATVPDDGPNFPFKPYNALTTPLRTGDIRIPVSGGFATPGQVAIQQDFPLPMQILAFVPEVLPGDLPQLEAPKKQRQGAQT